MSNTKDKQIFLPIHHLLNRIAEYHKSMINESLLKSIQQNINLAADIGRIYQRQAEQLANALQGIRKFNISESLLNIGDWFQGFEKAGLTSNLGEDRSIKKLKQYKKLLSMGYPIFWVPRAEVIESLLAARTEKERKNVVLTSHDKILSDCKDVLQGIDAKALRGFKQHLIEAVESMEVGKTRAAQSAASICFDSLLDQIIDSNALSSSRGLYNKVKTDGKELKVINNIPVQYVYAALQAQLIVRALNKFDRLNPRTVKTKYNRHASIHSVSSRQYNTFNALQVISITTSLLATTQKLGIGWMTRLSVLA